MVRTIMWLMLLPLCWLLLSWAGLVLVCHSHSTGSGWWWVRVTSLMVRLQPNWVQGLVTALPQLELSAANCGQAAAVTYYTPTSHHPPPPRYQQALPNIHYSTEDFHPAHCHYWLSPAGGAQDHRKLSGLGPWAVTEFWVVRLRLPEFSQDSGFPTISHHPSSRSTPSSPTITSQPYNVGAFSYKPSLSLLLQVKLWWIQNCFEAFYKSQWTEENAVVAVRLHISILYS